MIYLVIFFACLMIAEILPTVVGLPREDQQVILDEHNRVRRAAMPSSSNMELIVGCPKKFCFDLAYSYVQQKWDNGLAQQAQTHAEMCRFSLNALRSIVSTFSLVGENIGTSLDSGTDYVGIIQTWTSGARRYNATTGRCRPSACSRYTQASKV